MCRPVECKKCGKTTWTGCGQHVAQVKATVPAGQWCTCERSDSNSGGIFASLFSRK